MRRPRPLVEALRVKNPCRVGYANLAPETERSRHCAHCAQSVIDVSKLTRREVEALLEARERGARLCVHLLVREDDGAILLADGYATPPERSAGRPGRALALAAGTAALVACTKPQPEALVVVPVAATPPEPSPAAAPSLPTEPESPRGAVPPPSSPDEPPAVPPPSDPPVAVAPVVPAPVTPAPVAPAPKSKSTKVAPKHGTAPRGKGRAAHIEIDGDLPW